MPNNYEAGPAFSSFYDTQYMYQHQSNLPSPPTSPQFSWQVTTIDADAHTHTYNDSLPTSAKARRTQIPAETMSSLMTGPDPADGKYVCLYGGCMRRFGRKYNIQSHIQTHLADRPFRCNVCAAGFVRRHDLVRHARIHGTGKDFVCGCGKGFSRMDALNRHRQRQICVGGADKSETMQPRQRKPTKRSPPLSSSVESDAGESCGASSHGGSVSPEPTSFEHNRLRVPFSQQLVYANMASSSAPDYHELQLPGPYEQQLQQQQQHQQQPRSSMYARNDPRIETQHLVAPSPRYMAPHPLSPQKMVDQEMWVNPSLISPAMTTTSQFHSEGEDSQYYY